MTAYLVMTSTGTLKIFATFRIVPIQRPLAAAMWWVGPASLQRLQKSRAPQVKRVRMLVSPKVKMGPGSFAAMLLVDLFALRVSSIMLMLTAGFISLILFLAKRPAEKGGVGK